MVPFYMAKKKQSYAIQMNTLAPYQQRKTLHNTENDLLVNKLLRILHNKHIVHCSMASLTCEPLLKFRTPVCTDISVTDDVQGELGQQVRDPRYDRAINLQMSDR
jgi:hypothetical protein